MEPREYRAWFNNLIRQDLRRAMQIIGDVQTALVHTHHTYDDIDWEYGNLKVKYRNAMKALLEYESQVEKRLAEEDKRAEAIER